MVKSSKIFSPQEFLETLTGKCFYIDGDDVVGTIHKILKRENIESDDSGLWDYPLTEIDHIVNENLDVVLVDVSGFDSQNHWQNEYRWFEVTGHTENIPPRA